MINISLISVRCNHYYRFQISTLATKLGVRNIAFLGSGLLMVNYVASVLAAIYMPQVNVSMIWSYIFSLQHMHLCIYSWYSSAKMNPKWSPSIACVQAFNRRLMIPAHIILGLLLIFQVCSLGLFIRLLITTVTRMPFCCDYFYVKNFLILFHTILSPISLLYLSSVIGINCFI